MGNIFQEISGENEIFKDERVLMPEYLPEVLPHRENLIEEIAHALKGATKGGRVDNLLIIGTSGTGKTCSVRFVFRQLEEYSQKVLPIYVNCWEFNTRHSILNKIASALGEFIPRRGIASDEITDKIVELLSKEKKVPIVALDEMDRLFAGFHDEEHILYDLTRASEIFSVRIGVIGIMNNGELLAKMDQRIRSSLAQKQLVFKQYSPLELKDILGERAKLAFYEDALSDEIIPLCAAKAAKNNGDARLAISLLWKSGKIAEKENAKRIDERHVREAFGELGTKNLDFEKLSQTERDIIKVLQERGELTSGELYKLLKNETDRTVRNYLKRLQALNLIEIREASGRGLTRIIKIKK